MPDDPSDWRSFLKGRGIRGKRSRKFQIWIRRLYRTSGPGTPFNVEDMIRECGMNPNDKDDYAAAHRFLQKQFKLFYRAMRLFFGSSEFAQYYNGGLSPEQLFAQLVGTAITWNVFPLWSDPHEDRKYKLYTTPSFIRRFEQRGKAMVTEVNFKSEVLTFAFDKFPSLPVTYARPRFQKDGKFIALPPGIECEICHQRFAGQPQLIAHYQRDHPEFFRNRSGGGSPPGPPPGPPTGLDALFG